MRIAQYIEVDVDNCAETFGVAPCQASLTASPPTGTRKCFNSLGTCQDPDNFNNVPVTWRFAVPTEFLPADIEAIPCIVDIEFDPGRLSLGENLGERATLTVKLRDFRHSDTGPGGDKYLSERSYNAFTQGTFFGKWHARNPYMRGRSLRWKLGEPGTSIDEMETHHFVIDNYDGPNADGIFTIVAKDVLKLASGDRALAPLPNNGYLVAGIDDNDLAATLTPSGIGNAEYAASGYVAIGGSEICSFTRSSDALTIVRAQLSTAADLHAAEDRVQQVLYYEQQDAADIVADLLINYAGVDASFIPLAAWQAETAAHLNRVYTWIVANPTPVEDLLAELIQVAGLVIWWRDDVQQIGFQVIKGVDTTAARFTEAEMAAGSFDVQEQPDKRLSQVVTYFAQIDPLTSLTDAKNFAAVAPSIDLLAEANEGSAAIRQDFTRLIPIAGRSAADRRNAILLGRFTIPPRLFRFHLLRDSLPVMPELAGGYRVEHWTMQDDTGAPTDAPVQVVRLKPGADYIEVEAEEARFDVPAEDSTERTLIIASNINNYNFRTAHDSIYPAPEAGITVTCIVNAGVTVGSSSNLNPAFDVGDWPAGVTLILVLVGRIQGAGGKGGKGEFPTAATAGAAGGTAFYARAAITVDDASGEIFGGGGGGGAGQGSLAYGNGGGGGAGTVPGAGGKAAGDAKDGKPGTADVGGAGGAATFRPPGGRGGDPGEAGTKGHSSNTAAGAAGKAIDGISFVTSGSPIGDRRGGQVN
jgi:hypothetical protein